MMPTLQQLALGACLIAGGWAQSPAVTNGPAQPIPFNHKTHIAAGMTCTGCHTIAAPGDQAGFPNVSFCMGCHTNINKESPAIQELAGFSRGGKRVPWVRIYKLPSVIYFSHEVHYKKAKVDCAECHGPVAERSVLAKEKSIAMADCMKCHDARHAPNGCDVCHDSH